MCSGLSNGSTVSKEDPWEWWNKLRMLCGKEKKLCVGEEL